MGMTRSDSVQVLVDVLRNGRNFRIQLIFNLEQMMLIALGDEVDGEAEVTESTGSANSMEVGLGVLGVVEVDDDVDGEDVDTTSEQISAHQAASLAILELVINSTPGKERLTRCAQCK